MKSSVLYQFFLIVICVLGISQAMAQTSTFIKQVNVNVTTKVELTDASNQPLKIGGLYRVRMSVITTGTKTGIEYLAWYDAPTSTWKIRLVTAAGLSSNHPMLEVENNVVKVFTNHANMYAVKVFVEFYDTGNGNTVPYLFGSSFQWQRYGANLYYMDGKVGIATDSPKELLSVNGNIQAKEIKVTTTTADWPDYVFAGDYQLPTLKETAKFIEENKHLPGVPKAAEIERNGLSLGEMNKILMQKVEELTLHLIEKDKQLDEQNKSLGEVLERLEKLEKIVVNKF
jgi:hypothetical protein